MSTFISPTYTLIMRLLLRTGHLLRYQKNQWCRLANKEYEMMSSTVFHTISQQCRRRIWQKLRSVESITFVHNSQ
jgi:ribosomal protein L14